MTYLDDLPAETTLQIFRDDEPIFSSSGKWLHPLFEFEKFLEIPSSSEGMTESSQAGEKSSTIQDDSQAQRAKVSVLSSHDSAIGKAAAVLSIRLGITKIHADLCSQNALNYINQLNRTLPQEKQIQITYKNLVPKLMCQTEAELEPLFDSDQMYFLLRQRAKLVQGVEVSIQNLTAEFGSIQNLSFELKSGGHLMILGENGAGKTTLLRLLAGIYKPTSGSISIGGKKPIEIPRYTIGYIPQNTDNTSLSLSVEEVVGLGVSAKIRGKERAELIKKTLCRVSAQNLSGRSFNSLSGGEKQKISLARCLAQNAKLLLLDEPTSALDAENKKMVTDILRSLTISEIPTIIVVTHDKELANLHGWEKLVLGEGFDGGTSTNSTQSCDFSAPSTNSTPGNNSTAPSTNSTPSFNLGGAE